MEGGAPARSGTEGSQELAPLNSLTLPRPPSRNRGTPAKRLLRLDWPGWQRFNRITLALPNQGLGRGVGWGGGVGCGRGAGVGVGVGVAVGVDVDVTVFSSSHV